MLHAGFFNIDGRPKPISALLIDSPGAQTLKQNADHFIKRWYRAPLSELHRYGTFLFADQCTERRAGHRTSLRGGGPLSTLVALDPEGSKLKDNLWRACWLNVVETVAVSSLANDIQHKALKEIFPGWRLREQAKIRPVITTPMDTNPLQMYWGMPRRIRLDCVRTTEGNCDLCGDFAENRISQYVTQKLRHQLRGGPGNTL